jgi:hypothetical protein
VKIDIAKTTHLFIDCNQDVENALKRAVHAALLEHKRAGNPVAVWQDGKVVILQPDEIEVDSEEGLR